MRATVDLPGSKSLTNRALVLAALADGPSTVHRPLVARDTTLMADALGTLGADVDRRNGDAAWTIAPGPFRGGVHIDCGLAGTLMRFVPPVAALADGLVTFDGDPHARTRPMRPVLDALRRLGVEVIDDGRGTLPFTVIGAGGVPGGEVTVDASASSQFVSALLLAGARFDKGLTLRHDGPPIPSLPHVEMTIAVLAAAGVDVDVSGAATAPDTWRIEPSTVRAHDVEVEPDLSNAAPFLAAAVITGGDVAIPGWPRETTQPGALLPGLLTDLGADVRHRDDGALVVTGDGNVAGIDVDLRDASELTPVVAALAALADGPTTIRGVAHIRGHETDRLAALASELNGLGGDVEETADGLVIRPRALHGGVFRAYADHRMAQAGAVVGLRVAGVEVDDISCTTKTLADFPGMWSSMIDGEPTA